MSFPILGYELNVSEERKIYNALRRKFVDLAEESSNKFIEIYTKENHNLDDVSKNAYAQGLYCIQDAIDFSLEILLKKGIYHVDRDYFIEEYYSEYHIWDEEFAKINDQYMELVLGEEALDQYRVARRKSRGKLVGGGFGLSGAAKGIAKAGAVNMAFGAGHAIFNGIGKVSTSISIANKKKKIFDDEKTLLTLSNGVYRATFSVHYALIDAINDNLESKNNWLCNKK